MLLQADDGLFDMHESVLGQIGMDQEHHHGEGYGNDGGWVEINGYSSSQHQSPIQEYGGYGFIHTAPHSLPSESTFSRMPPPQPSHTAQHQLLPLIMPSHPTWPSMLTNPAGYQVSSASLPPPTVPLKTAKLPAIHAPSPRKTLTDDDRRRMCRYHEENPSIKQTEIGGKYYYMG